MKSILCVLPTKCITRSVYRLLDPFFEALCLSSLLCCQKFDLVLYHEISGSFLLQKEIDSKLPTGHDLTSVQLVF